jgi:hypothetical protein
MRRALPYAVEELRQRGRLGGVAGQDLVGQRQPLRRHDQREAPARSRSGDRGSSQTGACRLPRTVERTRSRCFFPSLKRRWHFKYTESQPSVPLTRSPRSRPIPLGLPRLPFALARTIPGKISEGGRQWRKTGKFTCRRCSRRAARGPGAALFHVEPLFRAPRLFHVEPKSAARPSARRALKQRNR